MSRAKPVLIVIPTYNEADNIEPLVGAVGSALKKHTEYLAEVLFVDDSSPDGTAKVITALQRKNKRIHLLSGSKEGLGKAYIRGLTHGLGLKKYYAIVTMDADLSHDPEDIPRLLKEVDRGADYVIGSRYVRGGRTELHYSLYRRFVSFVANVVAKHFAEIKSDVRDQTSGFKAIRADKLRDIPLQNISASGYVFIISLLYEFDKRNSTIREIPITFHSRQRGTSKMRLSDALEFMWYTFRLNPHARLPRFIRFAGVGASGTVVNLAILTILVRLARFNVDVAYLVALEVSIISNFTLNHLFTFKFVRKTRSRNALELLGKLVRYNLVSVGGIAISLLIFAAAYHGLGWNYLLADALGIVAAMSWNYWLSVRLVWRIVDRAAESQADG